MAKPDSPSESSPRRNYKQLIQSTAMVTAPTLISRILGYFRDMLQAFFLGTGLGADAFAMAYVIPNLLRSLTAEGHLTAAFIPVFTRVRKEQSSDRAREFASTVFYNLGLILLGLIVLGIVLAAPLIKIVAYGYRSVPGKTELTIHLLHVMFPYLLLISLAALCSAILNAHFKFGVAASSSIFFNAAMIVTVCILARKTSDPAYAFAIGVIAGGLLQLLFQVPFVRRVGIDLKPRISFRDAAVKRVGKLMLPGILGLGIFQINVALGRLMASLLEEGSVSALYYATRVAEFTLGLFSIALGRALLPMLSLQVAEGQMEDMKRTLVFAFKFIAVITIPASLGLLLLAGPIIRVLFERGAFISQSTRLTVSALVFFSLGLPFSSGNKVLKKAFFSLEDTRTPVKVAAIAMGFYLTLSFIFMQELGIGGLALGLACTEAIYFSISWNLLQKKIGGIPWSSLTRFLLRIGACTAFMGAALFFLRDFGGFAVRTFWQRSLHLVVMIAAGMGVYFLSAVVLIRKELSALKSLFFRSKPASPPAARPSSP